MLLLLPLWVAIGALLIGWGLLLVWLLDRGSAGAVRGGLTAFQTLWLGYAGLLVFLFLWAFVLPLTRAAIPVAMIAAIAGFALERRAVVRRLAAWRAGPRMCAVVFSLGLGAWLATAYAASDHIMAYDTYLYHLQVVKWNATYSVVPGLANLHLRLGYDNSVHLFGGFVDAFWQGEGVHATNGFLMAAAFTQWAVEIFGARTPRGRLRQVYCLGTLPFLLAKLWYVEVASYSSDLPLALFALLIGLELLSLPRGSRARLFLPLTLVLTLGAVAVTTKLVGLALFAVVCVTAVIVAGVRVPWRTALAVLAVPAGIFGAWLVRNAIISGWLLFPVIGRLPLPWAVPRAAVAEHISWIESWARIPKLTPDQVFSKGFLHWFLPWFDGFRQSHEMTLLAAAVALVAWRIASRAPGSPAHRAGEWATVVGCALTLAQWFIGAPDVRFGGFAFWMLPAAVFACLIGGAMRDATTRTLVLVLSLALCAWNGGLTPRLDEVAPKLLRRPPAPEKRKIRWLPAGPDTLLGQPWPPDQCSDATLPCTPEPSTQTLRDPDSLGAGFTMTPAL